MKKILLSTGTIFIALTLFSTTAFSWAPATHVCLNNALSDRYGFLRLQEMYGSNGPDFPWILFGGPTGDTLPDAFGDLTHEEWNQVEALAWWGAKRAFAGGGRGHILVDTTAHDAALTLPTPNNGYVYDKQELLCADEEVQSIFEYLVIDELEDQNTICHLAIEFTVDLGVAGLLPGTTALCPTVGWDMFLSAWLRSPSIPWLLVWAYADELAPYTGGYWPAAQTIIAAENGAREVLMQYGLGLMQADGGASLVSSLIDTVNEALNSGLTQEQAAIILNVAISLVIGDYAAELQETIDLYD